MDSKMSNCEKDSVQIRGIVTNAARRGSMAQLRRSLESARRRFRRLAVAQIISENQADGALVIEKNDTSNHLQAHLQAVLEAEQLLRSRAKSQLNYEGVKDNERLRQESSFLLEELRSRQDKHAVASQQVSEALDFVSRLRESLSVLETRLMARRTELSTLTKGTISLRNVPLTQLEKGLQGASLRARTDDPPPTGSEWSAACHFKALDETPRSDSAGGPPSQGPHKGTSEPPFN
ncbi:hypothetical protein Efla_004365 [Eimeria flavescens]